MLEKRVERLEKILASLEPKITELLLTCAKKDDMHKLQLEFSKIEGRIGGLEGRMSGIEGRLSMIPTMWQTMAILATLLIGLTGLIFTTAKFLHP